MYFLGWAVVVCSILSMAEPIADVLNRHSKYSPAFVYHTNLFNREDYIADSLAHEIGHNLGQHY